jgi:hypothetical protein
MSYQGVNRMDTVFCVEIDCIFKANVCQKLEGRTGSAHSVVGKQSI